MSEHGQDANKLRRTKRYDKARQIERELEELFDQDPTMSVEQAMEVMAKRHDWQSGKALAQWLWRNRPLPPGTMI
jgi:hypothetical protein